ncbi:Crp/Fnr family transcriptional regulator [Aerococcaceae bacterium NML210727]|nr:Crp/Fnr family transcriptional regulator [Aerococcaceae bacterium NML210727]MCW6654214.1 Crp/Fnr family transcriptional regulator [Aerococcaceae bacterium NML201296]MCW6663619.1 Crp/Fnr family transcriptional regulator [Aerococcaceae bacterium NML190073]MCW6675711.1 Crp/Fnr family transcriptional regulator [Aerococcaceae bacterium NML171108]MCW6677455.1 Crp/Fnr family transcriptional regulator [Aerococcaceae bacterium NML180378]MCW6681493.1 Crp/Fnr family transcriptional regulator [Aerococc
MITSKQYRLMREHDAFKHFTVQQFDVLSSHAMFRKLPRNQILFFEGDVRDKLYFIHKGYAKIEQYNALGDFVYLDFVKEGTFFPYGGMFVDEFYHYTATAMTDMEVFYIPTEMYERMLRHNVDQMQSLCQKISNILRFHELKLRNLLTKSATDRVVQALTVLYLDLAQKNKQLPFPLTTQELAKLSGTTRETVSKVLKQLEKERAIKYVKKIITYTNPQFFSQHIE